MKIIQITTYFILMSCSAYLQANHVNGLYFPVSDHLFTSVWVGDTNTVSAPPANWFNLDATLDKVRGVSTERAYKELLKNKQSQTVIVAVIDSGVDIDHEDLKDHIWINTDEIAGNGQDDDANGYIDDVNGWSFIGGSGGENVDYDSFEVTREYARLKDRFEEVDILKLKRKELKEFAYFYRLEKDYEKKLEKYQQQVYELQQYYRIYQQAYEIMEEQLGDKPVNRENVEALETEDPQLGYVKNILAFSFDNGLDSEELESTLEELEGRLEYGLNLEFDSRDIVGDNYSDLTEKGYGNNDVKGPNPMHGTHVSGIIAADRTNALGMKGIADNVKIMVLRAVPNGDERDKDVANAIYYAVNNGAKVINMSFGKDYSPQKQAVDAAMKYAEKMDVLLIHGAGNDGKDIDVNPNFPTSSYKEMHGKKRAKNWIEVGATSWKSDEELVANFSNYGKTFVDVFAPGVAIYSTVPNQAYDEKDGTSMAAPVVAGIAALIRSYYPAFSAAEVRNIILDSAVRYPIEVNKPGEGGTVNFSQLSATGAMANAYEAVKLAIQRAK